MAQASLSQVREFFGIEQAGTFRKEWTALSEQDKSDLRNGIGDGTLTY